MNRYLKAVKSASEALPDGDQKKIIAVTLVQIALSLLDLVGVALIGIIGAISITGIQSAKPGNKTSLVLRVLHLGNFSFYNQIISLAILAVFFLIGRTAISMFFTRKYLRFLGLRSAFITTNLFSKLISQNILKVQERNSQETLFQLTEGVRRITIGILGNFVFLISDISLLAVMTLGLLVIDPIVALVTFILFGAVATLLHLKMSTKSRKLGKVNSDISIENNKKIIQAINSYRETLVRNRRSYYAQEISEQRTKLAKIDAELAFMPMISKYVLESAVILGAFAIAGLQFAINDSRHAVATLAIFMAAGSRIGPALMRVQQGIIQIGIAIGSADSTFALISDLEGVKNLEPSSDYFDNKHSGFLSNVSISELTFNFGDSSRNTVEGINLNIHEGETIAIVGSSGAGKTTLVDLLLGVLEPKSGRVLISGMSPIEAFRKWPGAVSYVPQEVALVEGSLRENICMGYPVESISEDLIWNAIDSASLKKFVDYSSNGLDTQIGELGSKVSGGERQRIGIARALVTDPKLIILDEATSALDGGTEAEIAESIQRMKGRVTIVMIAHRLSTVRSADRVLYLEGGRVTALGKFDEVRKAIPNFDSQARLMGL
jgi:ABC-type multidrug transport system fused ATPase/permease subunit